MSLFIKQPSSPKYPSIINPGAKPNYAPDLKPTAGNSIIDVVNNFPWTLSPANTTVRKEVPFIVLTEYLQLENQMNQSLTPYGTKFFSNNMRIDEVKAFDNSLPEIEYYANVAGTIAKFVNQTVVDYKSTKLYDGFFDLNYPTDFSYKLPFFTQEYFNFDNTWKKTDILDFVTEFQRDKISTVESFFTHIQDKKDKKDYSPNYPNIIQMIKDYDLYSLKFHSPTVGLLDPPSIWEQSEPRTYTFQFPLFNINQNNNTNSSDVIQQNWELCYLLTYQNLINKNNFYTGIPPVYYEVFIPGIHYCKASYISDLEILNIGNTRLLSLPIGDGGTLVDVNVPDAYMIAITIQDLLMPSKNLLSASINPTVRSSIRTGGVI